MTIIDVNVHADPDGIRAEIGVLYRAVLIGTFGAGRACIFIQDRATLDALGAAFDVVRADMDAEDARKAMAAEGDLPGFIVKMALDAAEAAVT